MSKGSRAAADTGLKEGVPAFIQQAGLYILMGALLLGVVWNGGYFPNSKLIFTSALLIAGGWELMVVVALAEWRTLRSYALWILAAFALWSIASHTWTSVTEVTDREAAMVVGFLAAMLVPRAQALRLGVRTFESLFNWLIYTAGFVAAWGIITYILRTQPYVAVVDDILRAGSTFQYSNALSCFELMALPVTLAMHQQGRQQDRPLYATAAALEVASVVLAFSRLGLVVLAAVLVYFMVTAGKRKLLPHMVFIVLSGVLIAATSLVLGQAETWPAFISRFFQSIDETFGLGWEYIRPGNFAVAIVVAQAAGTWLIIHLAASARGERLFSKVTQVALAGAALVSVVLVVISERAQDILRTRFIEGFAWSKMMPHREATWDAAWEAFKDKPVKGWGLGEFYEIFRQYETATPTRFAHNLVLNMAVDTGIIGAVLITGFLVYMTVLVLLRVVTHTNLMTRALAIAVAVFIFYNMFDWEWYLPAITAWFMVAVVCVESPSLLEGFNKE